MMKNKLSCILNPLITAFIKLRWVYFYFSPFYTKVYLDLNHAEIAFRDKRTGRLFIYMNGMAKVRMK